MSTYYIIKKGQFAYNKSYSNGYPYGAIKRLNNYDIGVLSSLYICFELYGINSDYICFYFDSNKWNKEVRLISGEGARNHGLLNLSADDFFNISLYIPNVNEQEKISKLLLMLYKKIEVLNEKINVLKKYKKGFIEIFTRNRTKTEFKELRQIVRYIQSTVLINSLIKGKLYPVYDASGVPFIMTDAYKTKEKSIAIIKYGSSCGRTFLTSNEHTVLGTMGEMIPFDNKMLNYIYAYTKSENFKRIIHKYIEIGTTPNLYFSDYGKALIPVVSENELYTFDNVFNTINFKIEFCEKTLKILNKMKKDMLKKLFL